MPGEPSGAEANCPGAPEDWEQCVEDEASCGGPDTEDDCDNFGESTGALVSNCPGPNLGGGQGDSGIALTDSLPIEDLCNPVICNPRDFQIEVPQIEVPLQDIPLELEPVELLPIDIGDPLLPPVDLGAVEPEIDIGEPLLSPIFGPF